jgi:hypothetical protein
VTPDDWGALAIASAVYVVVGFCVALAYQEQVEAAFEQIFTAVGRAVTWPVRRFRARRRTGTPADAPAPWMADPAGLWWGEHNTAAADAVAINERKTMENTETTTGAITRSVDHTALSWAVGDVRRPVRPRERGEYGDTYPDRLELRVMIPRSASNAEREAEEYGVVSAGLTLDEAESFALGLLGAVATARVEQRTSAVTYGEPAL